MTNDPIGAARQTTQTLDACESFEPNSPEQASEEMKHRTVSTLVNMSAEDFQFVVSTAMQVRLHAHERNKRASTGGPDYTQWSLR